MLTMKLPCMGEARIESGEYRKDIRTAQPTHGIRFLKGKLQQAWLVIQHDKMNKAVSEEIDWRDVPNVE